MSTTSPASSLAGADRPDSTYAWIFQATTGEAWGGWLVADSVDFSVGHAVATAYGQYTITAEEEHGTDLTAVGLDDGEVHVDFYFSAALDGFLATRAGPGVPVGLAGLGSELDAAWLDAAWVEFGRGGAVQASAPTLARFTWVFEASGGDRLYGTLIGDARNFGAGDRAATAHGAYRILTEEMLAPEAGETPGSIHTTRYWDANLGRELTIESAGALPTGAEGFGSETDRVWTGTGWAPVGQGGALQADGVYSLYRWRFEATSGDRYDGWLYDTALSHAAGDTIAGTAGRYVIETETPSSASRFYDEGTIWLDSYHDALSGSTAQGWYWHTAKQATPLRGLGNEHDWIWDGDAWDEYGRGGQLQADIERYSLYRWRFEAASGDRYDGWIFDDSDAFAAGDTLAGTAGHYVIETETAAGTARAYAEGTVWLDTYFDAPSNTTTKGWYWHSAKQATPQAGLGNERDWIWDGDAWDQFGLGGQLQADVEGFSLYRWRFEATSGDRYDGWLYGSNAAYAIGDTIAAAAGEYVITAETGAGHQRAHAEGTVWLDSYFDSLSGGTALGWYWHAARQATPQTGLGNEFDWVWDGDGWDEFGRAGQLQADFEPLG